jgi:hypothetical protein
MIKLLIVGLVLIYLFRKVFSLLLRVSGNRTATRQQPKREGEIHIDHIPDNQKGKYGKEFKGGEYVDYEEV